MFFNDAQKNAYIDAVVVKDGKYAIERVEKAFDRVAVEEGFLRKDVSCFSPEELSAYLSTESSMRSYSSVRTHPLRRYVSWCFSEGLIGKNPFKMLSLDYSDGVRENYFSSPMHLQKFLDEIFEPPELNTNDCTYRSFFWLVFSGIPSDKVLDLRCSQVDLAEMTVLVSQKKYPIYQEASAAVSRAKESKEFLSVNRRGGYDSYSSRKRADGDYLLRGIRSSQLKQGAIRNIIHLAAEKAGIDDFKFSGAMLYRSGVFYRSLLSEMSGEEIDFLQIAEEITSSSAGGNVEKQSIQSLQRTLSKDYIQWKKAFLPKL